MPAPPEFLEGLGEIGSIEVFGQRQSQHLRDAQYRVHAAGKVTVQLQRIQQHSRQRICAAVGFRLGTDGSDDHAQPGGNDQFFQQSPHGPGAAVEDVIPGHTALPQIALEPVIPLNGADEQVGQISHKQGKSVEVFLRRVLAFPHVHIVGDQLQGKVRHAQSGDQLHPGNGPQLQQHQHQGIGPNGDPRSPGKPSGQQTHAVGQQHRHSQISQSRQAVTGINRQTGQKNKHIHHRLIHRRATWRCPTSDR